MAKYIKFNNTSSATWTILKILLPMSPPPTVIFSSQTDYQSSFFSANFLNFKDCYLFAYSLCISEVFLGTK